LSGWRDPEGERAIRVSAEVRGGAVRFTAAVWAESIERAINLADARYPGAETKVLFLIEPEAFVANRPVPRREWSGLRRWRRLPGEPKVVVRPSLEEWHIPVLANACIAERETYLMKAMVLAAGKDTRPFPAYGGDAKAHDPGRGQAHNPAHLRASGRSGRE
jgi:hypothetical protein